LIILGLSPRATHTALKHQTAFFTRLIFYFLWARMIAKMDYPQGPAL